MQKELRVEIDRGYGTAGLLSGLPHSAVWKCNVLTSLLWIGILTAPPRYRGFDLSTFWAWLRYASAISERDSSLRLRRMWSEIDAHQKTVMSDDFGMGFSCHYLAEQHGLQAFANTSYLLDSLVGISTIKSGKRGPAKSPDFIGIDAKGGLHILECKGTQSSKEYLLKALAAGIGQKNNLTGVMPFASSMVGGIFVPQHGNPESAVLMYIDPAPDPRLMQLARLPPSKIEQAIFRISLAKELMAAGLWRTASLLEGRDRERQGSDSDEDVLESEILSAGFVRDNQGWNHTMQYRSIEIDAISPAASEPLAERSRQTRLNIKISDDVVRLSKEILLMDRLGAYEKADQLIVTSARQRRVKRPVEILAQGSEKEPYRRRVRKVESAWEEQDLGPTSAALTGPSGIRFELSRQIE